MVLNVEIALDNIRSVHNVGSLFRTADAAGVKKMWLCGITPGPLDRFDRVRTDIAKVALGAEKTMVWEAATTTIEVVKARITEGYRVIALEQHARAVDYRVLADKLAGTTQPILLVVGNEVGGVDPEVLALAHDITFIPQHGHKESMNVAVATGIALFRLGGR